MTDDNGSVQFTTIYPGWYGGRAIHIHSRLEPSRDQMKPWNGHHNFYLNNSINELVHTQPLPFLI